MKTSLKEWLELFEKTYYDIAGEFSFKEHGISPQSIREALADFNPSPLDYLDIAQAVYSLQNKGNIYFDVLAKELFQSFLRHNTAEYEGMANLVGKDVMRLDAFSMAAIWAKTKQVYCFDESFAKNLYETDNICLTKDLMSYLPSRVICIDLSQSPEMRDLLRAELLLCSATPTKNHEAWNIHITRCFEESYITEIISIPNDNIEKPANEIIQGNDMQTDIRYATDGGKTESFVFDRMAMHRFVLQALSYLASERPDIQQDKISKIQQAQFKRNGKKGDMPIGKWNVGERYGAAFRKWEEEAQKHTSGDGTGVPKKPHVRRAHWHTYWYNQKDENGRNMYDGKGNVLKIARPRWVHETFCNVDKDHTEKLPIVKHKVKTSKEERDF